MDPISFSSIQGNNLPLGARPDAHSEIIIDLTNDDNPPALQRSNPNNSTSTNPGSHSANQSHPPQDTSRVDDDDEDIIITGETLPSTGPQTSQHAHSANANPSNNSSSRTTTSSNQIPNPFNLTDPMATLTANIYAGLYTRNVRNNNNQPPQPSSSNLTIRDSPPPQTRRSNTRTISFGGGGRFSGGRFSGFITAGLNGLRGLTTTAATRYHQQQEETLQEMFSNWGHTDHHHFEDDGPTSLMGTQLHGNLLSLSPHQIFAAIYDFDHPFQSHHPFQTQESGPPPYKEKDSHPLKIKAGFSKEIIPLDREVLSLDSDSQSYPFPEKQGLRPVCASCDEDLLINQDSCGFGKSEGGRRPWILACGHVVDSSCLEQAKVRAREIQAEIQSRKIKNVTTKPSPPNASARGRPPKSVQMESKVIIINKPSAKRRKLSNLQSTSSSFSTTPTTSNLALRRKERADAREARKSIDSSKSTSSYTFDPVLSSSVSNSIDNKPLISNRSNLKGKSKEDIKSPSTNCGTYSITTSESTPTSMEKSKITDDSIQTELTSSDHLKSSSNHSPTHLSTKRRITRNDINLSWIKCPVKGCKGSKGDILAPTGSKNAPWQMFV